MYLRQAQLTIDIRMQDTKKDISEKQGHTDIKNTEEQVEMLKIWGQGLESIHQAQKGQKRYHGSKDAGKVLW